MRAMYMCTENVCVCQAWYAHTLSKLSINAICRHAKKNRDTPIILVELDSPGWGVMVAVVVAGSVE